jgi:hypothetical protein
MTNGGQRHDPSGFQIENEMDLVLGRAHPNPSREGCPPAELLQRLARRELPIGDPAYDHIGKCSPCYQELRTIQQTDAGRRVAATTRRRLAWAAAAILLISVGAGAWLMTRGGNSGAASVSAQLDLRPYAIARGETQPADRPPLQLTRGRVLLTLLLPTGSEPGPYDVEIRIGSPRANAVAQGNAELRDQVTNLQVTLDLAQFSRGTYQLAVRRQGEDWQTFPVQLR